MGIPTYGNSWVSSLARNVLEISLTETVFTSYDPTGWKVTVDAGAVTFSKVATQQDRNIVWITLDDYITEGQVITVEYQGGGDIISVSTSEPLAIFGAQTSDNYVNAKVENGNPLLLSGEFDVKGNIKLIYVGSTYAVIRDDVLRTPSIIRDTLMDNGLVFAGDGPGKWSVISKARDSVFSSLV